MKGSIWFITEENKKQLEQQFEDHYNNQEKIFILLDENTRKCCYPVLTSIIPVLEQAEIIEIQSGEENKSLDSCRIIWDRLLKGGADRRSVLINLGGGVICDLGGFAASLFKRGIRFYHIPTTLLAQADAAIGGKTGVNLNQLKNQIGLFSMAEKILINTGFLNTLDPRQFRSGFAEVLKIALVADEELLVSLLKMKQPGKDLTAANIEKAVRAKEKITQEDFREEGKRKLLNFGHTIGHGVESLMLNANKSLLHGEAVAVGMVCESFISLQKGMIDEDFHNEIRDYILFLYGKVTLFEQDIPQVLEIIDHDKKNIAGKTRYTLITGPGRAATDQETGRELQEKAIRYYISCVNNFDFNGHME